MNLPPLFSIIGRWFWLICIAFSVIGALRWRRRNAQLLLEHPELAQGFARLLKRWVIWSNLPWVVMGVGCVFGGLTVFDYLKPQQADPYVIAFFLTVFVLGIVAFYWIVFRGGAEEIVRFPGLYSIPFSSPRMVKCLYGLSIIAGAVAVVFMVAGPTPLPYWKSEGPEYTTVFLIYDGYWRVFAWGLLWLAIGGGVMTASIIWIRRLNLPKWWNRKEALRPGFLLFWSVLWLIGTCVGFGSNLWRQTRLVNIFRNGQAKIVEGHVHVLHEQPFEGHAKGDVVEVGDQQFVIDYFVTTAAYNRTIAYGGELRESRNVRIWYYDGEILALAVRR